MARRGEETYFLLVDSPRRRQRDAIGEKHQPS